MNPQRRAMITGLCYSIPLALWFLPLLQDAAGWEQAGTILQQASATTLLLQGTVIALFVPLFLSREISLIDALGSILLLIAVPWPLLALAWLAESVAALPLLLAQLALGALALLLQGIGRLPRRWPMPGLLTALLQITVLVMVIHLHNRWLIV